MTDNVVPFVDLAKVDLHVDAIYEGGSSGHVGDDPIARLLNVGNMGGFRPVGTSLPEGCRFVALFTTGAEDDWPDEFDPREGAFTYFGDNKTPGGDLLDTSRGGNRLLRYLFDAIHSQPPRRETVPPIFVFEQLRDSGRDVRFLGLAVPGVAGVGSGEDLTVISRGEGSGVFQNYRAQFTILDCDVIQRVWVESLRNGPVEKSAEPEAWRCWVDSGVYQPRVASYAQAEDARQGDNPVRYMVPTGGPDGWRHLLADPEKHWRTGRSAKTLAHSWETANGWPSEVELAFSQIPALANFRPVYGFPEFKTPLPGGSRASQTDLLIVAMDGDQMMTVAVEGKVDEPFGEVVETWLGKNPSSGKSLRLGYLADVMRLSESDLLDLRYQLVHRTASAKIEADRNGSHIAMMLVHSWAPGGEGFNDYQRFASRLGVDAEVGSVGYSSACDLWLGWVQGDGTYLRS